MKRFLAILLIIAMLPIPATFARETDRSAVIPEEAFDAVYADVWEEIEAIETEKIVAKRGRNADASDYAAIVDDVIAAVEASDTFVEGSINRNGAFFTWRTTEGIACGYSPRLRAQIHKTAIEGAKPEDYAGVESVSYAPKGGYPSATNVAVFQPYYGLDSSFKTTYSEEGKSIAQATGGTSTTYITNAATIDAIADAFESCAVVIFDSHGDTDYYNPSDENDFVTRANTSYICLQSNTGITSADMATVTGPYGSYQHAYYAGSDGSMKVYCVDGTAIANHMEKSAPHNMLWSAICLGMATDGLHAPLRAKGVEVAYGYSQSVTFYYDYQWEAVFWDNMIAGKTVAESAAAMKTSVGNWDYIHQYSTISQARSNYAAFPIFVSSEDTYPGHGNVDNLQTVKSTFKLKETVEPTTAPTEPTTAPSGNEYVLTTSLKDGDQVIIYNASAGKAMSEDAVSTNYRAGVDVTVSGNKIVTDDSKIVWTVRTSGSGYTFLNDDGETLSATKGLSFAMTDNVWAVNPATTANSVYIVSTTAAGTSGDPKYIEWYDKYSEFSTYYYSANSEAIFAMQLFVLSGSVAPTEPTTAPTEPTTAPTQPTTAPSGNEYVLTTSLKDGDQVIIYNASAKKAMSEDA
ncbi:MAG: hypothetical protein IJJ99_08915, partial [Oscillospiraceae bacterium]|nr:hypothetical protein [Oscillospiraceae bacterium]